MKFRISRLSYLIMTATALCPVHPLMAANLAWTGGNNLSTSGVGSSYSRGSHGSITFAGDDDFCGADNVVGRRGVTNAVGGAISAFDQYQRFMNNTAFNGYHPYGTSSSQVIWTGDGTTSGNIGYQGTPTGGTTSALPIAYGVYSWASGCGSYATGNYSTAFGSNATATGAAAQAFGVSALASGTTSVAMGVGAEARGDSSVALGPVSVAKGTNSVALGMGAQALNQDDVALGSGSTTAAVAAHDAGTLYGKNYAFAGGAPTSALSIGSAGHERQLQNLAAGAISATSTDAINGSQLFATNSALDAIGGNLAQATAALGGGAGISSDGKFTAPNYLIQGSNRSTVGDALVALDTSVTANTGNLTTLTNNVVNGTIGLLRQDPLSKAITVAAASGGNSVNFSGSDGVRTLSGIKDASLAADSSEAVTGRQLNATNTQVTANAADIAANTADITANKTDIATNKADIATNTADIATNTTDIAANTASLGAQAKTLTQHDAQLGGLTASLGGGAAINADGSFTAPSFRVQGAARGTVGDALAALDTSVTSNTTSISDLNSSITSGAVGLVRQDATSKAITVAATSGGSSVNFSGSDGARTLSGIKDASLAADSSEAVTGRQLNATNTQVTANAADIAANSADIATNTTDIAANTASLGAQAKTLTQHDAQLGGLTASLGGGAAINADGSFTAPSFRVQGAARGTVGDALAALDTSVTSNTTSISDLNSSITSGAVGLVRQDATSKAITVAAASGGNSVNFSGSDGARTLSGIADASLTADSSEAVTGRQLNATNTQVTANAADIAANTADIATNKTDIAANTASIGTQANTLTQHDAQLGGLAASLGGGAAINADGSFTAPSFQVQGAARGTVGDALAALDTSVTSNTTSISDLNSSITNITNGAVGLVRQDATSKAITVAATSGGSSVNFSGSDGARTLSGIKDASLAADSREAVTGRQLNATNTQVTANAADIATNTTDIAANTASLGAQAKTLTQHDAQLGGLTASLGGGAAINADGSFTAPSFQVQGAARGTVGDALAALDTSVTSNTTSISDLNSSITSGAVGLVRQDATSKAITVAATSGGSSVNFSGSDGARTLSGIKDASLAADSSEAVTGRQLNATNSQVTANAADIAANTADIATSRADIATNTANIATNTTDIAANTASLGAQAKTLIQHDAQLGGLTASLGGGAAINADGSFTAPSFQVQGAARGTVGDALAALDTSVTSNTTSISDLNSSITSGAVGLVRQDATSKAITVAATSGGNSVNFSGSDGARTLSGIKDASLAADSSEAVTGRQLNATNTQVTANAADIAANTADIATNKTDIATNRTDIAANTASLGAQAKTLTQHDAQLGGLTASLGGGAAINADGSFTAPSFQVQGAARGTVGDALAALDTSVTSNTTSISDLNSSITSGAVGLVRQDATSKAITVAATSGGSSVNFSGSDGARTLSGIRDASLAADSSEAVTGRQLYNTDLALSASASALGGGAAYVPGTGFVAPSYLVQGQKKTTVGDALYSLDDAVTANSAAIGGMINGTSGLVRQQGGSGVITIGSASGGHSLSVSGSEGNRVVTGVANGKVNADSHDAVNGSQLYDTNQAVAKNSRDIDSLSGSMQDVIDGRSGLVQQESPDGTVAVASNSGGSSVAVNGSEGNRRITGVGDGINDSDAATVGQLKDIKGDIGSASMLAVNSDKANKPQASGQDAIALGAKAQAGNTGSVAIGSGAASQGERAVALGERSEAKGNNSLALGSGSKASGVNSVALGSNSTANEDNVVSVGSAGHERRMTNLARGVNVTDAATVGQMNDGFASLQNYTDRQVNHLNKRLGKVQDKLTAGVASAMALSGIPQAYQPDSSLIGAAGGSYGGASAIAVGMSHISENGRWITKLQASGNTQSDFGGTIGVGYQW